MMKQIKERFINNTISKEINDAMNDAHFLFHESSPMMKELILKNDFKYDSGLGEDVYKALVECDAILPIYTYKPAWRFTRAIGYYQNGKIHINIYKLKNLKHSDLVGLLIHEYSHCAGFKHGNNFNTKEKQRFSVPYFLSSNIERWL